MPGIWCPAWSWLGTRFGLVAPVLVDIVLSGVPRPDAGAASGVTNTVIQVAAAAGIAATGAIFTTVVSYSGDIDLAARNALWYAVGAFAVGLLLSFTLPAPHPTRQNAVA